MADFASSLPIRTESAGDVIIQVCDSTIPSQRLLVNADGSINVNSSISATDLDIRDLAFATDKVDASGSTVELGATTLAALENITVVATDLDVRDISHSQDSIKIGDGTELLAINSDGSINVKISDKSPGSEINDYNSNNSLAAGATGVHTYTSVGNFYLTQLESSGSGKMKITVNINGSPKFVQFNSNANPNMSVMLSNPILVTTGQTVTIDRKNRENQPQDVFSTIIGYYE